MNDLNAQQIVLLTLLVSFVTSIATGITTVSLLERAPEPVTQTINRVVEKTVERVVEVKDENSTPGTVERIVETVVVNAEDLTIEAVQKNSDSLVRIYSRIGDLRNFVALGVIISPDGKILADSRNIVSGVNYVAHYDSGEKPVTISFREANNPFAVLGISEESSQTFLPATFGESAGLQLGQSVIAVSGQNNNVVTNGIVTSLETVQVPSGNPDSPDPVTVLRLIDTSVDGTKVLSGSILLNLKGEIVAARIGVDSARSTTFLPVKNIKDFVGSNVWKSE